MKPDGAVNVFPVDRDPTSFFQSFTVWPHKAIPNGLGGVLVAYDIRYTFAFTYHQARLRLVNADGTIGGGSALGGTSTLGSWGPRLGRDGGDLVLGEEWVKATSYRTIGTTTVARITDFTRVASSGLDVFLDGGDLPGFTALEGGEFFASYADGTTSGPDPDHTSVQLANAIYAGGRTFFGSTTQGTSLRTGPAPMTANTDWSQGGGGQQATNSTDPIAVDNTLGSGPLLVLDEDCWEGFFVLPAGSGRASQSQRRADAVKPSAWLAPGAPEFSQDWYKVFSKFGRVGVKIGQDGNPIRHGLNLLGDGEAIAPDCDWGTGCFFYSTRGGRKKEPDWSQANPTWQYPAPPPDQRRAQCGPQ